MAEQYTPTTEGVRGDFISLNTAPASSMDDTGLMSAGEARGQFDRWLAARDAQVLRDAAAKIAAGSERQTRRTVELTLLAEADRIAGGTSRPADRAAYAASQREPSQADRDRVRMLLTHPHDGHGPSDTCLECQHTDQQNSEEEAH